MPQQQTRCASSNVRHVNDTPGHAQEQSSAAAKEPAPHTKLTMGMGVRPGADSKTDSRARGARRLAGWATIGTICPTSLFVWRGLLVPCCSPHSQHQCPEETAAGTRRPTVNERRKKGLTGGVYLDICFVQAALLLVRFEQRSERARHIAINVLTVWPEEVLSETIAWQCPAAFRCVPVYPRWVSALWPPLTARARPQRAPRECACFGDSQCTYPVDLVNKTVGHRPPFKGTRLHCAAASCASFLGGGGGHAHSATVVVVP